MIKPHLISKKEFYKRGGFSNPKCFRKHKNDCWYYYSY